MGFIWDVGLATWSYKRFYTNLLGYPEQYVAHGKKKVPHLFLLADKARALCGSVRDCSSAKMLLTAVTVGQLHAVLCSKLYLSTAYPSKSNKSYKRSSYKAKHGLPTVWFTLPWFYTAFYFSGTALDLQQCEWEENQL